MNDICIYIYTYVYIGSLKLWSIAVAAIETNNHVLVVFSIHIHYSTHIASLLLSILRVKPNFPHKTYHKNN